MFSISILFINLSSSLLPFIELSISCKPSSQGTIKKKRGISKKDLNITTHYWGSGDITAEEGFKAGCHCGCLSYYALATRTIRDVATIVRALPAY